MSWPHLRDAGEWLIDQYMAALAHWKPWYADASAVSVASLASTAHIDGMNLVLVSMSWERVHRWTPNGETTGDHTVWIFATTPETDRPQRYRVTDPGTLSESRWSVDSDDRGWDNMDGWLSSIVPQRRELAQALDAAVRAQLAENAKAADFLKGATVALYSGEQPGPGEPVRIDQEALAKFKHLGTLTIAPKDEA